MSQTKNVLVVAATRDSYNQSVANQSYSYVKGHPDKMAKVTHVLVYMNDTHAAEVIVAVTPTLRQDGKYDLMFAGPVVPLAHPIPLGNGGQGSVPQAPRYTCIMVVFSAVEVGDLFA